MNAKERADARRTYGRMVAGLAAAACLVGVTAGSAAAAKPFEHIHDRYTISFEEELCGIDVETTIEAKEHFKGHLGPNGFPIFQGNLNTVVTWYNPETGRTVTEHDRSSFKDLKVTDNGDGTITVLSQTTGIPEEIQYDDGTVAIKDVGRITFATVLDYNGTPAEAEDDIFISQEIVSISGPHPEAESDFTLFCPTVVVGLT